jgi:hypothetical protein
MKEHVPPSLRFAGCRQNPVSETNQGQQAVVPSSDLFGFSAIGVDGRNTEVLAGNLSPMGRLFEIYFVRLIGTPNQNYKKMPAPVGIKLVVQTNH